MDNLEVTWFSLKEMNRLVNLIPETDPRTPAYATLLESIERYAASAKDVDTILVSYAKATNETPAEIEVPAAETDGEPNVIQFPANEIKPEPDAVKPEEKCEQAAEKCDQAPTKSYTPAEVREALTNLRKDKGIVITDFLQETVGCSGFKEITEDKFEAVMTAIEKLRK